MSVYIARTYEYRDVPKDNEYRILVDRIWPRCVSKSELQLDEWARHLAPSDELRRWFGHDPAKWPEFRSAYRRQLRQNPDELRRLQSLTGNRPVTLLYSARDTQHNQAMVLAELLNGD